ncbi:hypothetical protein KKJ04_10720 [Xenorhabdus bovienii]|uniref:hypothetical protein n=1 Tax=Xenorhabdus bovienii TaxID=40576 RepID=UPI0023B2762C|nr:hypothetical protein [Xenorhabdus bovienii]MDE9446071.1 hypothetical protein [Xenorhabdus bovienii]
MLKNKLNKTCFYGHHHQAFLGHFPGNPLLPGVYYLREILALLPEEITRFSYIVKYAKFIKMVTPDVYLNYTVLIDENNLGEHIDISSTIQEVDGDIVAKIKITFKISE